MSSGVPEILAAADMMRSPLGLLVAVSRCWAGPSPDWGQMPQISVQCQMFCPELPKPTCSRVLLKVWRVYFCFLGGMVHGLSVDMVAARNIHNGSYMPSIIQGFLKMIWRMLLPSGVLEALGTRSPALQPLLSGVDSETTSNLFEVSS